MLVAYTKEDIKGTIIPPEPISAQGTYSVPEIQKWRLKDKENPLKYLETVVDSVGYVSRYEVF